MLSSLLEYAEPPERAVRIWTARLNVLPAEALAKLHSFLSVDEQSRAARFRLEKDCRDYVATRGLLRHLLGEELEEQPSALVFDEGPKGKPMLPLKDFSLRFNVSHSCGWAMFALAWNRDVGIDLEANARLGADADLLPLAQRILSPRELAVWRSLPEESTRRAAFLRAWTRKEAYAKATGEGIFDRLCNVELILDAHAPQPSLIVDGFAMHDLAAPAGFAAALALAERRVNSPKVSAIPSPLHVHRIKARAFAGHSTSQQAHCSESVRTRAWIRGL